MATLNHVFLIGNLTRDPEVRYLPSGDAVGDMHLAVSRRYKGKDGQDREEVCFIGVVVWGRQAENCKEYLRKGSPVFVEGRLQFEQWEKDGQKNSRIRVRANRVQFLGGGRSQQAGGAAPDAGARDVQPDSPAGAPPDSGPPEEAGGDGDNLPF